LGELLLGYIVYRRAKTNGTLPEREPKAELKERYVPKPLPPNATRIQKVAHWLGLEEADE
jgi:hypothetical protein